MKSSIKLFSFVFIISSLLFLFASCFSPYTGEVEMVTIRLAIGNPGNSNNARSLIPLDSDGNPIEALSYKIFLHGVGYPATQTPGPTMGTIALTASVPTGFYSSIIIRAYNSSGLLRAEGSFDEPFEITASGISASFTISMSTITFVTSWGDLETAITTDFGSTREEIIILNAGTLTSDVSIAIDRPITILANGSVTIVRGSHGDAFFGVSSGGCLKLGGEGMAGTLTLDGAPASQNSLIVVNDGTLYMYNGITLTNNDNGLFGNGGGVTVGSGGDFYMLGGTISGNSASSPGGGVRVVGAGGSDPASFQLISGTISGNSSPNGGGVHVGDNAVFFMRGGIIKDHIGVGPGIGFGGGVDLDFGAMFYMSEGTISGNSALNFGGGVHVRGGAKFEMTGGSINGNNASNEGGGVYDEDRKGFVYYQDANISSNTASVATTNNIGPVLTLGTTGPGGGTIFYYNAVGFLLEGYGNICHYLEAHTSDLLTTKEWASFGKESTDVPDTGTAIGTGRLNTILISVVDFYAPAAYGCYYLGDPPDDWFLPSREELILMYAQLPLIGMRWSSSQASYTTAFSYDGSSHQNSKGDAYSVRPIRAF